jgi:hypothetical protein
MLDSDLAILYGVTTRRLKEQVRRNPERFPADFMFELTAEEKSEVVANCDHLRKLRFSPSSHCHCEGVKRLKQSDHRKKKRDCFATFAMTRKNGVNDE